MQGLADGYFILPYTIGDYLARAAHRAVPPDHPEVKATEASVRDRVRRLLSIEGRHGVTSFHRELGAIMWEQCGMTRNAAGLRGALQSIPALRERFWKEITVPGTGEALNQSLEVAGRVADFLELGELMCHDALAREESCGAHFREEHQTPEGEAQRDDERFCHVAVWEWAGAGKPPIRHQEPLVFENVHLATRSYK
jgi:succinate dehydrogenase / fumarate reductase flavoprotein subunit